jgi:ATP-binding protein involved in chromosome partitioning
VSSFKKTPMPYVVERLDEGREVRIQWEEQGHVGVYPARFLRLACGCAACVEEMSGQQLLDPSTIREDLRILGVRLVGQYALYFAFNDGHSTGIYPYEALLEICPCDACVARREREGE